MITHEHCLSANRSRLDDATAATQFAAALAVAVAVGSFTVSTIRCDHISFRNAAVCLLYVCMAFGVYKGNRVAAVCLSIFFVINMTISVALAGQPLSWLTALFAASFSHAILATFEYHRMISRHDCA